VQPNIAESHVGLILEGRVQGVGFRWWTRREANRLGLRGTVRNRPDGSVEVHAAGPAELLDTFGAAIRVGPPGARVEKVRSAPSAHELPPDFRVIG
jgi:acylphosphatase